MVRLGTNTAAKTVKCVDMTRVVPCKHCPTEIVKGHWYETSVPGRRIDCVSTKGGGACLTAYPNLNGVGGGGSVWLDLDTLAPHKCLGIVAEFAAKDWAYRFVHPNDREGTPKDAPDDVPDDTPKAPPVPVPTPAPTPAPPASDPEEAFKAKMREMMGLDVESIRRELGKDAIQQFREFMARVDEKLRTANVDRVEVIDLDGDVRPVESPHSLFPVVIKNLNMRMNVLIKGPRGSGKTYLARQVADALSARCLAISCTNKTRVHDLFGFINGAGDYVPSLFVRYLRAAQKTPVVILIDEFDQAPSDVQMALNDVLESGYFTLPDSPEDEHGLPIAEKTAARFLVAANTVGDGANSGYISGELSLSTLDRFQILYADPDPHVENAVMDAFGVSIGASPALVSEAVRFVRNLREQCTKRKVNGDYGVRTMRTIVAAAVSGVSDTDILRAVRERAKMPEATWGKIVDGMTLPRWQSLA